MIIDPIEEAAEIIDERTAFMSELAGAHEPAGRLEHSAGYQG